MSPPTQGQQVSVTDFARYPTLATLRLEADDFRELRQQGSVCAEQRGNRTYFKLRFRRQGKQTVRYIRGAESANIATAELKQLQSRRLLRREFEALNRTGRKAIRDSISELAPLLTPLGFKAHGRVFRRSRRPNEVRLHPFGQEVQ